MKVTLGHNGLISLLKMTLLMNVQYIGSGGGGGGEGEGWLFQKK